MGDELEKALNKIINELFFNDFCKIDVEIKNNQVEKMNVKGSPSTIVSACLTIIKDIYDDGEISFDELLTAFTYIFKDEIKDLDLREEHGNE